MMKHRAPTIKTGKSSFFITFEGGEACGKSTLLHHVARALGQHYPEYTIIQTFEPGGSIGGQKIRGLVKEHHDFSEDKVIELFLMMAARRDHLNKIIIPALEQDKTIILCDRFVDSTIIYQHYIGGIAIDDILHYHKKFMYDLWPHQTFLLDLPADISLNRIENRKGEISDSSKDIDKDYYDSQDVYFHDNIHLSFNDWHGKNSDRIQKLDATQSPDILEKAVLDALHQYLS